MKKLLIRSALAAVTLAIGLAAAPALAISYYDETGRAYYFNNWGQKIYYDTGYDEPTIVQEKRTYSYYYPAPPDRSSTTTIYNSGNNMTARTVTYSSVPETCRDYNYTVRVNGRMETTYGQECLQPDGTWLRQ